jgi:GNAT superfamily N-acetyltransferase
MLTIDHAIDVFIEGFAYTRSLHHPVEVVPAGSARVVQDLPGRRGGPRTSELIVPPGVPAEKTLAAIRAHPFAGSFFASVFAASGDDPRGVVAAMKSGGYRLLRSEALMAIATPAEATPDGAFSVRRVQSESDEGRVRKLCGRALRPGEACEAAPRCRLYFIEQGGEPVAWGRSVSTDPHGAYVGGLSTLPAYRRRGMATAILHAIVADDRRFGAPYSVLLASKTGELVYRKFGYTTLGMLYIFAPLKVRQEVRRIRAAPRVGTAAQQSDSAVRSLELGPAVGQSILRRSP